MNAHGETVIELRSDVLETDLGIELLSFELLFDDSRLELELFFIDCLFSIGFVNLPPF